MSLVETPEGKFLVPHFVEQQLVAIAPTAVVSAGDDGQTGPQLPVGFVIDEAGADDADYYDLPGLRHFGRFRRQCVGRAGQTRRVHSGN